MLSFYTLFHILVINEEFYIYLFIVRLKLLVKGDFINVMCVLSGMYLCLFINEKQPTQKV